MLRYRSLLPALAALLLTGAQVTEPTLDEEQKAVLVRQVHKVLKNAAYVSGVDFSKPESVVDPADPAIAAAKTHREFAAAVDVLLGKFGVSHLSLWTPDYVANRDRGQLVGFGGVGKVEPDGYHVRDVLPGSPAEKAGIKRKDVIEAADGKPIAVAADLSGVIGLERTLTVRRESQSKAVKVRYESFKPYGEDSLRWLPGDIALITVNTFTEPTYDDKKIDAFFAEAKKAKGMIIDVRRNGGGYDQNVMHLASHVLPDGSTVSRAILRRTVDDFKAKYPDQPLTTEALLEKASIRSMTGGVAEPYTGKLVVLISGRSGSGGEMFPSAIKDNGRATLVGRRTVGALLIGEKAGLSFGFVLLYPNGELLSPKGNRLEKVGLAPDVELSEDDVMDDEKAVAAGLAALKASG